MIHVSAGARTSDLANAGLVVLVLLAAPSGAGVGTPIHLNGFETGLCTWSTVANPELCDGIDNDCDTLIDEGGVCMVCGDGFIIPGVEGCDDQNVLGGDGCSASCDIELGFECVGEPSVCLATCGDGLIVGVEGCDDQNVLGGDGCSASCDIEGGWQCSGEPSVCMPI